jgi:hypothetical protein
MPIVIFLIVMFFLAFGLFFIHSLTDFFVLLLFAFVLAYALVVLSRH